MNNNNQLLACEPMPIIKKIVGKKERSDYDIQEVYKIIKTWASDEHIARAGFERLRAFPGQSSQTGFSLGYGSSLFKTIFTILGIPFVEMEPRVWQKYIFERAGVQYTTKLATQAEKKKATKTASIQAAKQLFPGSDFKATERSRTDHDGITDAANIGLFIKLTD